MVHSNEDREHPAYNGIQIEWIEDYLYVCGEKVGLLSGHDGIYHLGWFVNPINGWWLATDVKIDRDEAEYIVKEICISLHKQSTIQDNTELHE